jgi:hypothetical protein
MNKLRSRTFWFATVWTLFVPISMFIQVLNNVQLPIAELILMSGAITTAYIGGNKVINNSKVKKETHE